MQQPLNSEFPLAQYYDLMCEVLDSGGEFTLYPKGTSMLPLIRQGQDGVVLVRAPAQLKRCDIPLYRRGNGQFVLHRVVKITDNHDYQMCGDNQHLIEKGVGHSQIIAVVCAVIRKGKKIKTTSFLYRLYVVVWCFMPARLTLLRLRSLPNRIKVRFTKKR